MSRFSDKVIQHLRFAKNWLDRAEEEYSNEQILQAELTLSLAEAEVRHAWETSRGSEVSATRRVVHRWRQRIIVGLVCAGLVWSAMMVLDNRGPDYPSPGYSLGQPMVPGRWDNQVQYQIVLNIPESQTVPAKLEQPAGEGERELPPTELPPADLPSKVQATMEPVEVESGAESPPVIEAPVMEVTPAPTPLEDEPPLAASIQVEKAPAEERSKVYPEIVAPPQLNLGELFKIANDALKSE